MAFTQSCSKIEEGLELPDENASALHLPKESEAYGKAVAQEIRNIALNFSKKGIDYTRVNTSPVIKKQVITELYKDIPRVVQTTSTQANFTFESRVPPENFSALTDAQLRLIDKILDEYRISKSDEALFKKLKILNEEIYRLPEIEQERLFNLSAALYYGLKEINSLKKEGLMAPTGLFSSNNPRLKSFSKNGDGGSGGNTGECKQTESATAIAVGSEIVINGVKHVVKQSAYAAARALWIVTACLLQTSSGPDCEALAIRCVEKRYKIVNGRPVKMECAPCRSFCVSNGYWNHRSCPLN
ncbi:hypothetical protein GCM10017764_20260 [Sphingobacterium griseoflavum]|uniref:Uncharacterized protein n=2 Tax=Sphingobacterium griseoflavum TaxID=1474952 RepID=A0ABQ3HXA3_9SPHI|nr:hypothetical protein GCM10017764_20260 [Sphingobacterium griseoflavum]